MLDKVLKEQGYEQHSNNCFLKKEKGAYHNAVVYNDQTMRLYGAATYIVEDNLLYDTGRLKINSAELIFLLTILNR